MQISVEITGSLGRRLNVTLPSSEFDKTYSSRVEKLARTAKLDGFRHGKNLPPAVIKQRARAVEQLYGQQIRGEAIEELLQSSLNKAITQENLRPAGRPTIQSLEANPGQPLKFSATFEVYPEVILNSLSDVTLEKTVVNIQNSDVERVLEQMRKQYAQWEEVQRSAEMGDKLTVDFVRIVDGKPQPETQQNNVALILDENMPTEFKQLIGAKSGDEVIIDLPEQA